MRDEKCIFCKLANGEIPTNAIYEDGDFKVILDADPATRGHALVIPKNHFANIFELEDETAAKALPVAKLIAQRMKKRLGCAGINLVQNNGEAAGQTVDHFHIHIIPRYIDDLDKKICSWSHQKFSDKQTAEILDLLKE